MSLNLKATEYRATHNGWFYVLHLGYKDRGWIVHRRREADPHIPPMLRVWTVKGWVPVLSEESHEAAAFGTLEMATRMIEEQTDE